MRKPGEPVWTGGFVSDALSITIHSDPASAVPITDLVGLAVRRNPKRAHLLVSQVLAKHVPTEPELVMAAGELLGAFVADELAEPDLAPADSPQVAEPSSRPRPILDAAAHLSKTLKLAPGRRAEAIAALAEKVAGLRTVVPAAVVLGYAETATGLGRLVANALGAYYIHSTRHATPGIEAVAGFEEGHSHATSHAIVPTNPQWLDGDGPVILVDDELSTGSTVINTIRELHALVPHSVYVVAALIDLRSATDRARFDELGLELGCRINVTALGAGWIELPDDVLSRGQALVEELTRTSSNKPVAGAGAGESSGSLSTLEFSSDTIAPLRSDRYGNVSPPRTDAIDSIATYLRKHLTEAGCQGPFVVLGCEENMFLPLAVSRALARLLPGEVVRFSTTTRSPIAPLDREDYAIASAITFASHDPTADGPGPRYAYNLNGSDTAASGRQRPGSIVVFPEPGSDPHDLVRSSVPGLPPLGAALQACADHVVVVSLPADAPTAPPVTSTPAARTPKEDAP